MIADSSDGYEVDHRTRLKFFLTFSPFVGRLIISGRQFSASSEPPSLAIAAFKNSSSELITRLPSILKLGAAR
jgi:hypothetical protein